MNNQELLRRIREDEPGAFEAFVDAYGDRIYGFGIRMCGEREDARDVLQDTLLQAYRGLKDLQHPEALKSWLFRVAANACRMKRRKGKYEPARELSLDELRPRDGNVRETEIPDPADLPDEGVARLQARERIREAIATLPPHYRMVLLLRDIEQFTAPEVADILGLPLSTVKMRVHRARLLVRDHLERAYADVGSAEAGR